MGGGGWGCEMGKGERGRGWIGFLREYTNGGFNNVVSGFELLREGGSRRWDGIISHISGLKGVYFGSIIKSDFHISL